MIILGNALVMGDNVNTDVLHPSRFFSLDDAKVRSGFMQAASGYEQMGATDLSGRIVLAGDNFGCGSSRETGARVFILAGVKAIVARSMARIFSRNVRNLGLAALECRALPSALHDGCGVKIDVDKGVLELPSYGESLRLEPLDPFWKAVIAAGGLMPFLGFKED